MINNSEFYNITYINGVPRVETTITQLWLSLQSQVLDTILYTQIFFLVSTILTLEVLRGQECTWQEVFRDSTPNHVKMIKVIQTICYLSLPLAMYGVLLCLSVVMGLNL